MFQPMHAAPAYTQVEARQTLQRPPSAPPPAPAKDAFSDDVRAYVRRAFDPENALPGLEHAVLAETLRNIITQAGAEHKLDVIDWHTCPIPQVMIQAQRNQGVLHPASIANLNLSDFLPCAPPMDGAMAARSWIGAQNKRKNDELDNTAVEEDAITPPWKKKNKGGLEERMTGKNKKQQKKLQKAEFAASALGADSDALAKRKQRFGFNTPEPSPYLDPRDDSPDAASGPIVGNCQNLEKRYYRLTAAPNPNTVRPLPVLKDALKQVIRKWKDEHNYNYACDQFKSIRQDLTVQHIRNDFTVKVYETHARIALEKQDLGEYNQCQTQLRGLHKGIPGGNPGEFLALRILYIIYTCNRTDMNDMLAGLTKADKEDKEVSQALQVRMALASGNYHRFFRLYHEICTMGAYLLDMIIDRERLAALAVMGRTYKPDVSLDFLTDALAFKNGDFQDLDAMHDPDAGKRDCLEFLCKYGGESFVERKEDGTVRFQIAKASAVFEKAKAAAFRGVDIKGQI